MTIDVSHNNPRVSYSLASGASQSAFTVNFEFFNNADLNVYVDGTLKTEITDYTVSGGDGSTGTVTFVSPVVGASGGSLIVITRDIAIERLTDFVAGQDINRAALNEQLDVIVAQIADLDDKASRSLQLNDYELASSVIMPDLDARKGTVLAFNETSGDPEAGPNIATVGTVAAMAADIATLADIEDGTVATDAISDLAAIASDVSTVSGISANVTTVAGISANVSTVASNISSVSTVALNIADVNTVAGISSDVTTVAGIDSDVTNVSTNMASVIAAVSSASAASASATAAASSATAAATSETNAATSETNAATSGASAATSASTASTAATTATTQASAAATSAANALTSETNAATSEANALTSETNAATSATAAATSATAAATSQTSAAASAASAASAYDSFDDRYLGAKSADPALDNDGDPLVTGALYFNTTDDVMKVYDGSSWAAAYASLSGALIADNNLSDLVSVSAAQTNLGLGTAATTDSTDYATAAQGLLASSALQSTDVGTTANKIVQLNGSAQLPAVDGSLLTGIEGVPTGIISLWSGSIASIPSGWALCDGTSGTPDLRNRFLVGAGSTYAVGDTGGAGTVALSTANLPSHTHSVSGTTASDGSHTHNVSGNTSNTGAHSHSGSTSNTGAHNHTFYMYTSGYGGAFPFPAGSAQTTSNSAIASGGAHSHNFNTNNTGAHSHNLSGTANSAGAHTHTFSTTSGSTGSGTAHENRPPYYALAYIMKT